MVQTLTKGIYFGDTIKKIELDGLILTEKHHRAWTKLPLHAHENSYFCTVLKGRWIEKLENNRERDCKPLHMQFHPPHEKHSDDFRVKDGLTFNIELTPKKFDFFSMYADSLNSSLDFYRDETTSLMLKIYREFKSFDPVSPLAVEGLMLETVALIARSKAVKGETAVPGWIKTVRDMVHDNFAEKLALDDIASTADVHPVYLARAFRKHFNCSVGEYQRKVRIEYACRELTSSGDPLAEIALRSGFYDQSHFSRTFKKIVGISPSVYRSWFE